VLTHGNGVVTLTAQSACAMIASMSEMDVKALSANFEIWCKERAAGLDRSKAFERYVAEQVLKDYDPADEDLDVGDFGGADDGGVDSMYLYVGGQLISEETAPPLAASDIELHIIQAKFESSFKEGAVEKLESFARDLLAYEKPVSALAYLNSSVRDAIQNFRTKYEAMIGRPHTLTVLFHYACMDSEIPGEKDKVTARARNLVAYVKSVLTLAKVEFVPWSAATLLSSARSLPSTTTVVPFEKLFSTSDQSTVCLVKLTEFASRILSTEDGHLQTRFLEPNVRDYQGRGNPVNTNIRTTLENPNPNEDFWWLNNGITILASSCGTSGDQLRIEDPEVVNGLQTSHEIFNWYATRRGIVDPRRILLRVIVSADDKSRTRIIKATNSQTKVSDLSLLSTEPIQQTIEDQLRLYGLFYDRKKGQCRRLKYPIKNIVGMRAMAQAVMAIALRKPDQARGRPETYIKNNAAAVFDPDADGDLYAACIILDRRVEEFLSQTNLSLDVQRDIRFYVGMFVISLILKDAMPLPFQIGKAIAEIQGVSDKELQEAVREVLQVYRVLGATDQAAKSKEMAARVQEAIGALW